MIVTEKFLYDSFEKFNREFFNSELPNIKMRISRTKRAMGTFHYKWSLERGVRVEVPEHIAISKVYNLTRVQLEEVIIHEMIHYYICHKRIKDNNAHGFQFRRFAREISNASKYNITCTYGGQLNVSKPTNKTYYIAIYNVGREKCFSRVSKNFAEKLIVKGFGNAKVSNIEVFTSEDDKFFKFEQMTSRLKSCSVERLPVKVKTLKRYEYCPF